LYRVTVQSIKEREPLPLDDELGASIGGRPMTLAALRAEIRAGLHQQKEMQARNTLVNTIMEKLRDDVAKVEIGPALINQQTQEDAAQQLQQIGGMGLDINEIFGRNTDALNNFLERIRPESERRLRNTLILREIGEHENIDVTHDDVHEEVHRLGMSHSVLEDERTVELIEADLRERKLLDRVIEIATEGRGVIDDSPESAYIAPPAAESDDDESASESGVPEDVALETGEADTPAMGTESAHAAPPADEADEQDMSALASGVPEEVALETAEGDAPDASAATADENAGTIDADGETPATDGPASGNETPTSA
jgi:trigger factor